MYGYGPFETSYAFDDYNRGKGIRRETEKSPDKENPVKLEYDVKLDKPPLLHDYAYTSYSSLERIKAPEIKDVIYHEGIKLFEGNYPELSEADVLARNNEYIIYEIE